MKKQLVSILFALCMVLCLVPLAAFAEESTETPPECSCETACTAENMNTDCPVCGAEGALPENCAQCARPADAAAAQPEGEVSDPQPEKEVSDPQPETALTTLIGGNDTLKEVNSESELTNAIADSTVGTVKLAANIDIGSSLTVNRAVTLDLNGKVLQMTGSGSVIKVESSGNLTLTDSNTAAEHKFMPGTNGLWVLNEASGTEIVTGGVITGGTGYPFQLYSTVNCGGGVYIAPDGQLTMTGGNIIGCSAEYGGGVCIYPKQDSKQGQFSMSGGSIIGCSAESGGGVCAFGKFQMSGQAVIRSCTAEGTSFKFGGGVWVDGSFEMSGAAIIEGCQAISEYAYGGGVYVNSSSSFVMSGKAKIERCQAISTPSSPSKGGGVHLANNTTLTLSGSAVIQNCTATNSANSGEAYGGGVSAANVREITLADSASIASCTAANGSGLYITGSSWDPNVYGQLYANGGSVNGDVVLGDKDKSDGPCTITGSGGTVFNGKVTVTPGSTIESGTFNGEVINNGTITGGVFNSTVSGSGIINGGTFNGTPDHITGSGTETDPYQINTAAGLKWFRDKVNNAKNAANNIEDTKICAELTKDIDLSGEAWTPIGIGGAFYAGTPPYSGTFDGKGHTIKNLSIDSSAHYVGLFGYVYGGTIRNLTVSGSVKGSEHTGGIAGAANGGTFENCANQCAVQGGTTGGIIGFATEEGTLIVRDCYNVGSITTTTGNSVGGIIGQCINTSGTIRNCYNAGTVTGTASVGAIIGNPLIDKIYNCYYLEGSVTRAGNGDKVSISKTATEFADGTVLALLKTGERDNNADPWADECKYLAAAGKTLPVFKGQGDTHNHQSDKWEHNDTEHWQVCTCGVVFNKAAHSGGKATCKAKAVCDICKESYGSPEPNNHTDLKHIDAKAATAAEEGNIEYWYCDGCKKYFSDAAAKTEITKAATVTATPTASPTAQPTTAPQAAEQPRRTAQPTVQPTAAPTVQPVSTIPATGDTSSPILWAALLLCSGAGLAVTAYKKNRHRS